MKIKITPHLIGQTADIVKVTDEAIVHNGEVFKLDSIPAMIEPTEDNPTPNNGPVYRLDDETISLDYGYSPAEQFDFINGNLIRYHDLNNDGIFDLSEAKVFFNDFIALPEEAPADQPSRRKYRHERFQDFLNEYTGLDDLPVKPEVKKAHNSFGSLVSVALISDLTKEGKAAWMSRGKK